MNEPSSSLSRSQFDQLASVGQMDRSSMTNRWQSDTSIVRRGPVIIRQFVIIAKERLGSLEKLVLSRLVRTVLVLQCFVVLPRAPFEGELVEILVLNDVTQRLNDVLFARPVLVRCRVVKAMVLRRLQWLLFARYQQAEISFDMVLEATFSHVNMMVHQMNLSLI